MANATAQKHSLLQLIQVALPLGTKLVSATLHHAYTTVNINLLQDIPMAVSEITSVFKRNHIAVARAQVEPLADGAVRHTYMVWSIGDTIGHGRDDCSNQGYKLADLEMGRLRSELEILIAEQTARNDSASHNSVDV